MLIRFAVGNFLSFKDKQVFSLMAVKHTRHPEHITDAGGRRILKGSFLFGANASGKSNFIKAVVAARHAKRISETVFRKEYLPRIDYAIKQSHAFETDVSSLISSGNAGTNIADLVTFLRQ